MKPIKIKPDLESLLTTSFLNDIAEAHLESWKHRYVKHGSNKRRMEEDVYINHDDILEIERVEEEIGRKLKEHESDYFCGKFHDKVIELWERGDLY